MSASHGLYLRRAIVFAWKNYAPLTALVDAARLYPPQAPATPDTPFVKLRPGALEEAFEASCIEGNDVDFAADAYVQGGDGEAKAWQIAAEMVNALDDPLDLQARGAPAEAIANVTWIRTQVIQDAQDATKWRALVDFTARIVA